MHNVKKFVLSFFPEIVSVLSILVGVVALKAATMITEQPFSDAPGIYLGSVAVVGSVWIFVVLLVHRRLK